MDVGDQFDLVACFEMLDILPETGKRYGFVARMRRSQSEIGSVFASGCVKMRLEFGRHHRMVLVQQVTWFEERSALIQVKVVETT
jgi:hypothetical protein